MLSLGHTAVKASELIGGELADCSERPLTDFFRDGCRNTRAQDRGSHTVCALMIAEFLAFFKARGNDLSTPVLEIRAPQPQARRSLVRGYPLLAV